MQELDIFPISATEDMFQREYRRMPKSNQNTYMPKTRLQSGGGV